MHYSSTFRKIISLYDEAGQLLAKDDGFTEADQARFQEIRDTLDGMWNRRRKELIFEQHGPPRMVAAPNPRSQRQVTRSIAHGIAPLPMPNGGD